MFMLNTGPLGEFLLLFFSLEQIVLYSWLILADFMTFQQYFFVSPVRKLSGMTEISENPSECSFRAKNALAAREVALPHCFRGQI